jgi:PAS domain S-box-containing protein/putative nucleotidyltransferase with HDIG domain
MTEKVGKKETDDMKKTYVFVAEDDEGLNLLIQKTLRKNGFVTEGFFTAAETIRRITENPDSILLLDFLLPDMTGEELIGALREKQCQIPFVVITGHGDEKTAVNMMKLGAKDYIVKTPDFVEVIPHVIERVAQEVRKEIYLDTAERALHESESKYRNLVETSKDLIWQCDEECRFSFLNNAWEETLGYRPDEMIGKTFADFQTPGETERDMVEFQRLVMSDSLSGYEKTCRSKSGKTVHLILNSVPMYNQSGRLTGAQGTGIDITKRVEDENEIRESKAAFFNMLEDVHEAFQELESLFTSLVRTMVSTLDAKSPWTKGHSERVAMYADKIAKKMGFDEEERKKLWLAGILHDIGKIGTYDQLLDKPGKLSKEEFEIVKKHPSQGAKILSEIKQLSDIIPFIRHHHERLDGRGYPGGLKGEEIPLYARILHVADSFDSMTSDRPYRPAPPLDYALSEFKKFAGVQFDPKVVEAFLPIIEQKE